MPHVQWEMQNEPVWVEDDAEWMSLAHDFEAQSARECALVTEHERLLLAELGCPDVESVVVREIHAYDRDDAVLVGEASEAAAAWLRANADPDAGEPD